MDFFRAVVGRILDQIHKNLIQRRARPAAQKVVRGQIRRLEHGHQIEAHRVYRFIQHQHVHAAEHVGKRAFRRFVAAVIFIGLRARAMVSRIAFERNREFLARLRRLGEKQRAVLPAQKVVLAVDDAARYIPQKTERFHRAGVRPQIHAFSRGFLRDLHIQPEPQVVPFAAPRRARVYRFPAILRGRSKMLLGL